MSATTVESNFLEQPKTPFSQTELPCGYLNPDDNKLYKTVSLREISGEEEDLLASDKLPVHKRLRMVLERCIEGFDGLPKEKKREAVGKLPLIDSLHLLIQLRTISLGKDYTFEIQCPACSKKSMQTVDLGDIRAKDLPEDCSQRVFESDLPKSKSKIRWGVMCVENEDKIAGMKQNKDALSLMILSRVHDINGQPPTLQKIKQLPLLDRNYLREQFAEHEGTLDDKIEFTCPHCGEYAESEIDIGQVGFFFPSGVSKR